MDEFCGDTFWNTSLLLDNTWPQLTSCFLDLVVTCAPCLMFWLVVPCHVYMTEANHNLQHINFPASRLCIAKLVCCSVLCILTLLRLLDHASRAQPAAAVTGDAVLLATMLAASLMTQYERSRCMMTSSPMFIFWMLKAGCDIVPLYTKIILDEYDADLEDFAVFVLSYALTLVLMVLYAFADRIAVVYSKHLMSFGEKACPETTASFLNKLTFAWLTRLMVVAFTRGVEMSDLWVLSPRDQSSTVVPVFEQLWAQEVKRCSSPSKQPPSVSYTNGHITIAKPPRHSEYDVTSERTPLLGGGNSKGPNHVTGRINGTGKSFFNRTRLISDSYDSENTVYESYETEQESDSAPLIEERPEMQRQSKKARPSLERVLFRQFGATMAVCMLQRLLSDVMLVSCPLLLGQLISHLNSREAGREWQGYLLALALFLACIVRAAFYACGCYRSYLVGLHVKSVVIGAVFNKALRINNEAKKKATSGEVTSLMSVDAQRLQEFISRIFFGMTVPVVLIAVIVIIYMYVQDAVVAGIIVLMVLVPASGFVGICQKKVQEKLLVYKDLRVKVFNEILNGMKVLKLYAWEASFEQRVSEVRSQEVSCLWQVALLYILLGMCTHMMAFLMTLATFGWYVMAQTDRFLDPTSAFAIMSLLNIVTPTVESLGLTISFFVQARVSVRRINDFLCNEELDFDTVTITTSSEDAIHVEKATFAWDDPTFPILKNIDLKVSTGRLVAVVGQVGAGKSSLINCILGEMMKLHGRVTLKGSVAYVAQQAWIQNATLRDNVLFGQPFHRDRYNAVVKACQLERDLSILQAGDMTEIGEKGTNLSGGQKQRVSLARAVYSDSDVYLLDDPLSAVDSHVGKAIFNDVIGPRGILKGKTRVLVTHGVHWLPLVDEIVVLKQGQISEVGSYTRLMQHNGDFAQFLKTYFTQEDDDEDDDEEEQTDSEVLEMRRKIWADVESATTTDAATSGDDIKYRLMGLLTPRKRRKDRHRRHQRHKQRGKTQQQQQQGEKAADQAMEEQGKLVMSETLVKGRVPFPIYLHYPKAAGLGALVVAVICFSAFRASNVGASFWLRSWTGDPHLSNQSTWGSEVFVHTNEYYLTIYGILGVVQVVLLLTYSFLYWLRTIQASRRLHDRMINCLLRAPMAFFDTTPIGRIMNRISTDMEIVDNLMPIIFRDSLSTFSVLISSIIVLVVVSPISAVVLIPLAVFCYFSLAAYVPMSRQCRRMEAITRSPIFAHFSETVTGASTIRAYRATERFIAESKGRVDNNLMLYYAWVAGLRWIQMSLDSLTSVVVFMAAIMEIASPDPSGGNAGLSVSYALQLSYTMNHLVRMVTDFETNIVSVERIKEYSEITSEAPWVEQLRRPVPSWPTRGRVELIDYQTRYRPGLELVLKGITCEIQGGEKIGIVGRTGAGKSSLSLALFRLIEGVGGAILIDGVNISDIGLHDLRTRLTILPQDPVLFSGPLRFNLDPFEEFEDEELWHALEQAHLRDFVNSLPAGLSYECGEEGLNLSVGQRQLVCLARTLLRKTRILVLDEATAAVDMETDSLIQSTVRQAFSDCTILTIAHRLNTIMDYDRILVLDSGTVREFDTPQKLQAKPDSVFAGMLKDAGIS